MPTISLEIEGMMCGGCVRRVSALLRQAGASRVDSIDIGSAKVTLEDGAAPESLIHALEQAGYRVQAREEAGGEG